MTLFHTFPSIFLHLSYRIKCSALIAIIKWWYLWECLFYEIWIWGFSCRLAQTEAFLELVFWAVVFFSRAEGGFFSDCEIGESILRILQNFMRIIFWRWVIVGVLSLKCHVNWICCFTWESEIGRDDSSFTGIRNTMTRYDVWNWECDGSSFGGVKWNWVCRGRNNQLS